MPAPESCLAGWGVLRTLRAIFPCGFQGSPPPPPQDTGLRRLFAPIPTPDPPAARCGDSPSQELPADPETAAREPRRRPAAGCPGGRKGSCGRRSRRRFCRPSSGRSAGAVRPQAPRGGAWAPAVRKARRHRGSETFSGGAAQSPAAS